MNQWLRALATLVEGPGLICSTMPWLTAVCSSSFKGSDPTSKLLRYCTWCTDMHAGKTLICKSFKKLKRKKKNKTKKETSVCSFLHVPSQAQPSEGQWL